MQFKRNHFLFYIIGVSPYLFLLFQFWLNNLIPNYDWSYFNSLNLVINKHISNFKLPFIDLHVCGGVDIFSNPQNAIFSPANIFYLISSPYLGNLLSLFVFATIGFISMLRLLNEFCSDKFVPPIFAATFLLSPFFSLHFSEGHIPFRSFYVLPLVFHTLKHLSTQKDLFKLLTTLCVIFLDGGLYMFFFTSFSFLVWIPLYISKTKLVKLVFSSRNFIFYFSLILLSITKALPVLLIHSERQNISHMTTYSLFEFALSAYNIFQSNTLNFTEMPYRAHEYSHYFGFGLSILLVINFSKLKRSKYLLLACFYGWISYGIGGWFNPWTVFKSIPYFNHAHIQSRYLLFMFFFLILYLAENFKSNILSKALLVTALGEMLFLNFYNYSILLESKPLTDKNYSYSKLKMATKYHLYIPKPFVYNQSSPSFECYEPAMNKFKYIFQDLVLPEKSGYQVSSDYNRLIVTSPSGEVPARVVLNFKWHLGWESSNTLFRNNDIIEIQTNSEKKIELKYHPAYYPFIFITYIIGLLGLLYSWRKIHV